MGFMNSDFLYDKLLEKSHKYSFVYAECSTASEYFQFIECINPDAILYNYYSSTMPWLTIKTVRKIFRPHIDIIHEVNQNLADSIDDSFFDFHIAPDPTLLLKNPIVFKTGRLVPRYENSFPLPSIPTIGSFGFGTYGKGFERLILTVQDEFDKASIRLHIPFAAFGDADGSSARAIAEQCKALITKPDIDITITHDFLDKKQLLDFLAQNSINAFFYEENKGRGISSVIDSALAVQRPIAISKSHMFRHIRNANPSICIEDSSLRQIINNGYEPLSKYRDDWTKENLVWDYERIFDKIFASQLKTPFEKFKTKVKRSIRKTESLVNKNAWSPTIKRGVQEDYIIRDDNARPVTIPSVTSFNRILDNQARALYKPVIDNLFTILPDMMARKMPAANIQQAFVLDTVLRFITQINAKKILSIGSYDDTAAAALKKLGITLEEIDPVLNYDLDTFLQKPTTQKASFDLVFSTSVIEHVKDDEQFVAQIAELLSPGGISVITCDYNDQYKIGDAIPKEDFHMYTQADILQRLLPKAFGCVLVDEPRWTCLNPDFEYSGYHYTFASFVFRKTRA